jgi:hypothetical protein
MMKLKLTSLTCMLALAGAVTASAQSSESTTKTKIEVKDGKDMKVTGCIASDGAGYMLTNVADKDGALHSYMLVSDDEDFAKLVGQRVQIEGTIADSRKGKVEIKTETKVDGPGKDVHAKVEGKGPYLGVKNLKKIAASCP